MLTENPPVLWEHTRHETLEWCQTTPTTSLSCKVAGFACRPFPHVPARPPFQMTERTRVKEEGKIVTNHHRAKGNGEKEATLQVRAVGTGSGMRKPKKA